MNEGQGKLHGRWAGERRKAGQRTATETRKPEKHTSVNSCGNDAQKPVPTTLQKGTQILRWDSAVDVLLTRVRVPSPAFAKKHAFPAPPLGDPPQELLPIERYARPLTHATRTSHHGTTPPLSDPTSVNACPRILAFSRSVEVLAHPCPVPRPAIPSRWREGVSLHLLPIPVGLLLLRRGHRLLALRLHRPASSSPLPLRIIRLPRYGFRSALGHW